jgi:Tol biopolymer transport system component
VADAEHPDWSPDGTRIAFESAFRSIKTMTADGGDLRELYACAKPCAFVQEPAWSPDGAEVAFALTETVDGVLTSRGAVVALEVATGVLRTVTEDGTGRVGFSTPRWSGDGARLVVDRETFVSTKLDETAVSKVEVVVVPSKGGVSRTVADWGGPVTWGASPDWSRRADLIVYSRHGNLHTVAPDGSGEAILTTVDGTAESAIQPTFTPDGTHVVYTHVQTRSGVTVNTGELLPLDGGKASVLGGGVEMTHPRLSP